MLKHNIKIIFRNFLKDKSTFLINLIGLSTGLACTILIFLWVTDEINMDKFHENDQQLYHVLSNLQSNNSIDTWPATPARLGASLQEEIPEVINSTAYARIYTANGITSNNKYLKAEGRYAQDNFFDIFSYELLIGNPKKVFPNMNTIVISEEIANKWYDSPEDAMGKIVSYTGDSTEVSATIAGVFKDFENNSSKQFDYFLSYDLLLQNRGEQLHWGNLTSNTYVLLQEGTDLNAFNQKINEFIMDREPISNVHLIAQQFSERYLKETYDNGVQAGGRITYVRLFSIIAFFILLIACINFMNLSTARATRKFKEIGVKKTIGANRSTLIFQYLGESIILSFLSLLIAISLVYLVLPNFNEITGKEIELSFSPYVISSIVGITLLTGVFSGSYPAFYLTSINPATIFKGNIKNSLGELWARKGLVVFQFSISIILIVSVLVVYKQIEFIQNKKLGYNKENIIHFPFDETETVSQDAFISELKNISGVENASSMWGSFVGQNSTTNGTFNFEGMDPDKIYTFNHFAGNYDLLEMFDVEMLEGRTFSKQFNNENRKILFNEAGIDLIGLENPVGKTFNLWGTDYEIAGIIKDFHYESLYSKIEPFFCRLVNENEASRIVVKIQEGQEKSTLAQIEAFYKKTAVGIPFDYQFLDEDYHTMYEAENRVSVLSKYFAGFAIIISCLGLFGLAAFTAQRRLKEISIRKVLGANRFSIVQLLTLDFTKMVLVAILIGLPLSYFMVNKWLQNFEFHFDLSIWYFLIAGLIVIAIAWLTVGIQTLKAANVNPTTNLKE